MKGKTSADSGPNVRRYSTGFNCTDDEKDAALNLLRRRSWLALRSKINEHTAEAPMLVKLKLVFEDKFRYDAEGVPRVWKPEDDIDSIFRTAKESVLELIPLYAEIKPADPANAFELPSSAGSTGLIDPAAASADEDFDFDESLRLLSPSAQSALSTRFRREADAYYIEAKRSMVASRAQIPYWIYGVLVILGWNEFVAVLRSPVYFTMLLVIITAAYVTWTLNMTGPALAVARGVSNEVIRTVNEQIHSAFLFLPFFTFGSKGNNRLLQCPQTTSNRSRSTPTRHDTITPSANRSPCPHGTRRHRKRSN